MDTSTIPMLAAQLDRFGWEKDSAAAGNIAKVRLTIWQSLFAEASRSLSRGRLKLLDFADSLALIDLVKSVGRDIPEFLLQTARPPNFNLRHDGLFSQAEVQARVIA
jgi:hypothetical protein